MRKTSHFKTHKVFGAKTEARNSGTIDYSADTSFRVKLTKLGLRCYRHFLKAGKYYSTMAELGCGDIYAYTVPGQLYTRLSYIKKVSRREFEVSYRTAYDV